ncbi:MAG TPA: protease complex subunit PrcB family protein, partial [Rhizobacter sp.]
LGAHCGADSASVDRIADAAGLRQAIAARTLGTPPAVPAADFDRSLVLRLSMGQQPNPGHRLGVLGARLDDGSGRLVIDTVWATPEPGRMYAAMVVQPCVIISVPRGDYRSVVVLDAQGRERMGGPLR